MASSTILTIGTMALIETAGGELVLEATHGPLDDSEPCYMPGNPEDGSEWLLDNLDMMDATITKGTRK